MRIKAAILAGAILAGAVLATLLPTPMRAQTSLGIKAGASFATLSNQAPDWKGRTGFAAGLALNSSGLIGIQPEVLYVQEGVEFNGTPSASASAPQLGYLEVPVLVKVMLPTPGLRPMAYAGPSIKFRLSCSSGGVDCSNSVSSTDWGAVLGGGVLLGGNHGLTIEGRYTWGLKDIHDPSAGVQQQTRTFLLMVGMSF